MSIARHPDTDRHSRKGYAPRPWLAGLATLLLVATALLPAAPAAANHDAAGDDPYYGGGETYAGDSYGYGTYDDGEAADYDSGYSYVRNLRGDATLIQADGERDPLQVNQPILVGDRIWVAPGSMAEVLLSDGNLLRIDGDSEVSFDALAGSPEARDGSTALRLLEGNVQLVVFEDALGTELPRFDLANASFYVATPGRFRLTSDRGDWAQIVARRGRGDVATPNGTEEVRAGFEVLVEGERSPRVIQRQAGGYDLLERWGDRLDRQVDDSGYVDDRLRRAAAPLGDHGSWVSVGSSRAWRPRVSDDWYPYTHGRWRHTSIGLTWVSSEPWGWVPYHYGTWDYVGSFGWVWFPGRTFSPARVHWYWGPSHVAWVPSGYYSRHYGHRTRYGVYGWAGGAWDPFDRWVFCSTRYFGHRYQGRYAHSGSYWRRHHRGVLPRGIVTTDTRRLTRDRWHDPDGAIRALRSRPGLRVALDGDEGGARGRAHGGDQGRDHLTDLPDVTPFIARTDGDDLPREVRRRVLAVDDGGPGERVRGRRAAPGDRPSRAIQVDGGDRSPRPRGGVAGSPRVHGRDGGAAPVTGTRADGPGSGADAGIIRRTPPREPNVPRALPRTGTRSGAPGATVRGKPETDAPDRVRGTRPSAEPRRRAPERPAAGPTLRARPESDAGSRGEGSRGVGQAVGNSPRFRTSGGERAGAPRRTAPTPASPGARAPRATPPRTTSPRATPPLATSPRGSATRGSAPRGTSPRGSATRGSSPRVTSPPARSPRSTAPRATSPRATPRATSPRGPRATSPRATSPRATPSQRPATRQDRAGTDRRPPAQRVLQGVRGSSRRDSGATSRRAPQRRAPGASSPRSTPKRPSAGASGSRSRGSSAASSRTSRGSQRPSASSRSSNRSRKPAAQRSSGNSSRSSGKASRSRGQRKDDNR